MTDEIAVYERLGARAWPAAESRMFGGWMFRASGGYTKRANSAAAMAPDLPFESVLTAAEAFYAGHDLPSLFCLTDVAGADVPAALAARGYCANSPTLVLAGGLDVAMPADAGFTLAVQTGFDRAWARGRAGAAELETRWWPSHERLLQAIEPPVAYATLAYGGADVAWGMAVLDGGRLGLFGLVTAAAFRGRGAGRVLLGGLLDWGKQAGAGSSWLQVTEANDAAVRLYRAAGFSDLYRYEYWQRERG